MTTETAWGEGLSSAMRSCIRPCPYTDQPVTVEGVESAGHDSVVFQISGPDIPAEAKEVAATCTVQTNRAGQRFVTMSFQKTE